MNGKMPKNGNQLPPTRNKLDPFRCWKTFWLGLPISEPYVKWRIFAVNPLKKKNIWPKWHRLKPVTYDLKSWRIFGSHKSLKVPDFPTTSMWSKIRSLSTSSSEPDGVIVRDSGPGFVFRDHGRKTADEVLRSEGVLVISWDFDEISSPETMFFLDVFTMKYMGGPCNFYPSTNPMIIGMEEMHGNAAIHWDLKGVPGSFGNIRWQAIFWYPSLGSMAVLTCDVSCSRVKVRALSSSAFNLQEFLSCSFSWLELVKFQVWSSVWHHHNNKWVIRKNLQ